MGGSHHGGLDRTSFYGGDDLESRLFGGRSPTPRYPPPTKEGRGTRGPGERSRTFGCTRTEVPTPRTGCETQDLRLPRGCPRVDCRRFLRPPGSRVAGVVDLRDPLDVRARFVSVRTRGAPHPPRDGSHQNRVRRRPIAPSREDPPDRRAGRTYRVENRHRDTSEYPGRRGTLGYRRVHRRRPSLHPPRLRRDRGQERTPGTSTRPPELRTDTPSSSLPWSSYQRPESPGPTWTTDRTDTSPKREGGPRGLVTPFVRLSPPGRTGSLPKYLLRSGLWGPSSSSETQSPPVPGLDRPPRRHSTPDPRD